MRSITWAALGAIVGLCVGAWSPALGQTAPPQAKAEQSACPAWESLSGDVYEEGRWRPLGMRTLFSEGWGEAWASPPNGEGGAPRCSQRAASMRPMSMKNQQPAPIEIE